MIVKNLFYNRLKVILITGTCVSVLIGVNFDINLAHAGMISDAFGSIKGFILKDKVDIVAVKSSNEVVLKVNDNSTSVSNLKDNSTLKSSVGLLRADSEEEVVQNDTISVYEVKNGDTIGDIAKLYDVSKNTIVWANDLKGKAIKEGDTLIILPVTGVKYTVKKGDTIKSLAKKFKGDVENIAEFNSLAVNDTLNVGDEIIIPDGEMIEDTPKKATTVATKQKKYLISNKDGFYMRPLIGGVKTQGIHGHNAVDIGIPVGASVLSSADGTVLSAKNTGYNGGYGKIIIIAHPNGTQTVYGHLSSVIVTTGERVTQGQVIGLSGNSGKSTGPHLHFEIRGAENPF